MRKRQFLVTALPYCGAAPALCAQSTGILDFYKERYLGSDAGRTCSAGAEGGGGGGGEGLQLSQVRRRRGCAHIGPNLDPSDRQWQTCCRRLSNQQVLGLYVILGSSAALALVCSVASIW